ncbi:CpaD family pilus assembly lipoprotein [Sphingomonas sp. PB2P19]|uniref:CpaD family pilus assembly protein n=1 Tax=Sphingomonas rhamnosi TaxID=3096156 RepID=UPI002FC6FD46
MITKTIILASLAPALLLGACTGTQNHGLESVHQPVVDRSDYAFDVATSGNALAPGEDRRLAGWMNAMHLGYGDRVAIDDPSPYGSYARAQVAGLVGGYGLLLSPDAPVTQAPVAPGTIRIVVTRMRATVPGCPDWSLDSGNDPSANTSSNYGCAINSNLAAMVANPADLVRGTVGNETNDAATSYKAIDTYRKKAPSGAGGLEAAGSGAK